jgi:holin (3TMs family)
MGILELIAGIFKPAADLIDNLHTSAEEKLTLQKEMQRISAEFQGKVLEYESRLMEAQSKIVTAEASSSNWLASSWRPITMLTFLALVVLNSFGLLQNPLSPQAWTLLQIGLGGYVVGRSGEKMFAQYTKSKSEQAEEAKG